MSGLAPRWCFVHIAGFHNGFVGLRPNELLRPIFVQQIWVNQHHHNIYYMVVSTVSVVEFEEKHVLMRSTRKISALFQHPWTQATMKSNAPCVVESSHLHQLMGKNWKSQSLAHLLGIMKKELWDGLMALELLWFLVCWKNHETNLQKQKAVFGELL